MKHLVTNAAVLNSKKRCHADCGHGSKIVTLFIACSESDILRNSFLEINGDGSIQSWRKKKTEIAKIVGKPL